MIAQEAQLRGELVTLASTEQGRRLLQLALRGIARGERVLTAGCWRVRGDAGCLFQHAYWEGVKAGVFPDHGRPGDWIGSFVGARDYGVVIDVIAAFDQLARAAYVDVTSRRLGPDRAVLRQPEWHTAVQQLLMSVLGAEPAAAPAAGQVPVCV